jgi:hypothetical protein
VKLLNVVALIPPIIAASVLEGVATTVPLLCVNVPLLVKLLLKVNGLSLEALKVPVIVICLVTAAVGSLALKSRVPAVISKSRSTLRVPESAVNVLEVLFTVRS